MKAYPYMHKHPTSGQTTMSDGMDLRDYFAGLAMQGIQISKSSTSNLHIAQFAYMLADEMMKQREVKNEQS